MAPRPQSEDPRRSFLRRPSATSNDAEASSSGTKHMEDSQDRMQNEVNLRLQQLGLPPGAKEANNGEIFARFMRLAAQKGVYIGNTNRDEEEDEEGDGEENVQGSQQYDSDATTDGGTEDEAQPEDEEEKTGRGPTELKGFWKNYEPNQKVNVEFNHLGQPCSINTSELANFIGSLVKGKEISLEYSHWSHVPKFKKEKLWNTVKFFFNIDDIYKDWVISSAGKKWKDFKCWLKIKHYDDELTTRQNIAKGCGKRIPRSQWKWLVRYWKTDRAKALSELNKLARESQSNARHTTGSRGYAVVQDQQEIKEGRKVGRAELFKLTHMDKDGVPVDDFAADKIGTCTQNKLGALRAAATEAEAGDEVLLESPAHFRIYKSGRMDRLNDPTVMPAGLDAATGVTSRDVVLDAETGVSVRLYLPKLPDHSTEKLPVLVYFHGGAFLIGSADDAAYHSYVNALTAAAGVLVVSADYRLAPEHPLPAAYEDCWAALQWAVAPSTQDEWISKHGETARLFLAGDSAGANIVHEMLVRAAADDGPRMEGAILLHPWFSGSEAMEGELPAVPVFNGMIWSYTCPGAVGGADDPRINPLASGAPSLEKLPCERMLVCAAEKDVLATRIRAYHATVGAGSCRAAWFESEGEDHDFFLGKPDCDSAKQLLDRVVAFIAEG